VLPDQINLFLPEPLESLEATVSGVVIAPPDPPLPLEPRLVVLMPFVEERVALIATEAVLFAVGAVRFFDYDGEAGLGEVRDYFVEEGFYCALVLAGDCDGNV